ncbi:MAG: ABC transporter substrate-binding protein [Acidimicrobiia bacterium]|nr:ABC transporter substrate-binding protein [bacterium]MXZ76766.1 ABC transporter substrate-binding protein [Acidimicrobiia bacterium]MXZ85302.1 ABC transporter substrate-binding protein [Acidimicrobiia bacterium]MYB08474.1 ABC transporter substrate-binding protein [Acidimicrobiia bacterium]MYE74209.1 ABC transporter substrate-binding protein [Acidimicrobiia bacterium]
MRRSLLHKLLALLAALALVVAACGNDDDDAPAPDAAPAPADEPAEEPMDDDDDHEHEDDDDHAHEDDDDHEHDEEPMDDEPMDDEEPMDDAEPMDDEEMATSRTWGAYTYEIDFEPSTRGVSDDTVRLGAMTQDALYGGFTDGINARLGRANRDGELPGGRQVELVQYVDDGSDPQANFEGARSMVENDEVFGIMVTSAVSLPQTTDYLAENQVPFTGWGFMPGFCAPNDWGFGFNGCLSGYAFGVEGADPLVSVQNIWYDFFGTEDIVVGIFNSDDDAGRAGHALYETLWAGKLAFNDFVPTASAGGITDPTRFVNTVLEHEPDLVILSTDFAGAITLKATIAASGYEGPVADYLTYVPGLPGSSPDLGQALEGGYAVTQVPPVEDASQPAIQQLLADYEAVGAFPGFGSLVGYWSADLMIQMIAAAGEDLNTASFYQAVNIDGFATTQQSGGLGSVKWPADHVIAPDCTGMVQVVDAEYAVAYEFVCYGDPDR